MKNTLRLFLLSTAVAWPSASSANDDSDTVSDSALRERGIFNSELPGTERKNHLKLVLHPHFGDLARYDYLRTDIGVRYGLSTRFEVSAETKAYFGHGLGDAGFFSDPGFTDWKIGGKLRVGETLWPGWDTVVGLSYQWPTGNPPSQVTDGFKHTTSYVTFARPVPDFPGLRFFWGLGADLVGRTSIVGRHEDNDLTDSSNSITTGFVWERGPLNYTFETSFATTRLLGDVKEDVFTIRPGVIWSIPKRYTFNSRGQWMFGLALLASEGPDGTDFGIRGKLRISFDAKRLWRRDRN